MHRNGKVYYRQTGELLHPQRFGRAEVDQYRKALGTAAFYAQYQQAPVPPAGNVFSWEWFKICNNPPDFSELVLSVDVAATENGGNYSAFLMLGHRDEDWYLVAVERVRYELPKVRKMIEHLDKKYRPDIIVINSTGVGRGVWQELRHQGFNHAYSYTPKGKEKGAASIVSMIEAGRVHVLTGIPGLEAFRDEVVSFPNGKYCDQVDSMVQVLANRREIINYARLHKRSERASIKSKPTLSVTISEIGRYGWTRRTY